MKANVPEKIYLYPYSTDGIYEVETKPLGRTVEYIQTDAFIEKACGWIREKWDDNYTMPIIIDSVIEDFRKYMKGE